MNDAKSTPFAYTLQVKNPCFPLSSQKAHVLANSPTIFRLELREVETLNFAANRAKSARFAQYHRESREISVIHTNF